MAGSASDGAGLVAGVACDDPESELHAAVGRRRSSEPKAVTANDPAPGAIAHQGKTCTGMPCDALV